MFIPIVINQQDILDQYSISRKEVEDVIDYAIKEVTAAFASEWSSVANNELHGTRSRYNNNLRVVDEGRMQGAVILDYSKDPLVKMIEEGASPFDMKEGFSKSAKKHVKADGGWYLTIPFKIGTPGAQIESGFSSIMTSQVYNIIKNKSVSDTTGRSKGISAVEIGSGNGVPQQFQIPTSRAGVVNIPESKAFAEYKHKSNINQGIFKQTDKATGQSSYGSFRRVSDKSDNDSWVYPGMDAKNLAEKAYSIFETKEEIILQNAINSALSAFGFE